MENIKEWFRNLFTFCKAHFRLVLELAVIALILIACVFIYVNNKKITEEIPVITTTTASNVLPTDISTAFRTQGKSISSNNANQLTKIIERTTETKAPTYQYYTSTDSAADKVTQQQAKANKADVLVKQQDKKTVGDTTVVDNKYYAITNARKHSVSVGAADINNEAYATISYRNRDITYTGYYNPSTKDAGAGVSIQIASW